MPKEHIPFGNSAGPRGLDEVRAHRLNHVHSGNANKKAREDDTEGERWQDQVTHRVNKGSEIRGEKTVNRVHSGDGRRWRQTRGEPTRDRQPAQPNGEDQLQNQAEPEDRDVVGQRREDARPKVCRPITSRSGEDAKTNPQNAGHNHRGER